MLSQNSDLRANLVKYAAFILNQRPYFRHKLREKLILRSKKLEAKDYLPVIEEILNDLTKSGYLNDSYLAEAFVRRQLSKGYGPRFIKLKLQALKLSSDTISLALESQASITAQIASAKAYLAKKRFSDPRKAVYSIYRRGFDPKITQKIFSTSQYDLE